MISTDPIVNHHSMKYGFNPVKAAPNIMELAGAFVLVDCFAFDLAFIVS
jgi:hypothetical protein